MPGRPASARRRSARRLPGRPGRPHDRADHQARPRHLGRLRSSADAEHLAARTRGEVDRSLAYSKAGVDSGEIIIRGGSHLDFSFIPTRRSARRCAAPSATGTRTAWFDKYLKHHQAADNVCCPHRWREDPTEAAVDPNHDGNAFSFYYLSRLDIHRRTAVWDCENLRAGCPGMTAGTRRLSGRLLLLRDRHDA